jgi:hypothetical protein
MPGQFSTAVPITGGAVGAFSITPGASALTQPVRAITLGVAGVLVYTSSFDQNDYTTDTLPAGTYPLFASHVLAATTAASLTGWI